MFLGPASGFGARPELEAHICFPAFGRRRLFRSLAEQGARLRGGVLRRAAQGSVRNAGAACHAEKSVRQVEGAASASGRDCLHIASPGGAVPAESVRVHAETGQICGGSVPFRRKGHQAAEQTGSGARGQVEYLVRAEPRAGFPEPGGEIVGTQTPVP